jgi:hypothetical protein
MKTAFLSRKRGPFNRPVSPSLLRDGTLETELQPMVTGIRGWRSGLKRFRRSNRVRGHALPKTLRIAPIATLNGNP